MKRFLKENSKEVGVVVFFGVVAGVLVSPAVGVVTAGTLVGAGVISKIQTDKAEKRLKKQAKADAKTQQKKAKADAEAQQKFQEAQAKARATNTVTASAAGDALKQEASIQRLQTLHDELVERMDKENKQNNAALLVMHKQSAAQKAEIDALKTQLKTQPAKVVLQAPQGATGVFPSHSQRPGIDQVSGSKEFVMR